MPFWGIGVHRPTHTQISFLSANFRKRRAPKKNMSHFSAIAHCIFVCVAQISSIK